MKRVLIIGASVLQLPAILKAKELGYDVAVADYDSKAAGIPYADEFFNVSTIDIQGIAEAAKSFHPDGIMTLATDLPMRSVAAAAKACGLPGIDMETAIKATDKGEMIKAFDAAGVEHPRYWIIPDEQALMDSLDKLSYPCVMKPTDSSGSRGVVFTENRDQLKEAYSYSRRYSRDGTIIVEEYLHGDEVSVEVMTLDGIPHVLQVTDKLTTGAPHFVEMGHSQPSRLAEPALMKIRALACRAVQAIGIECGPAHVEIMLTGQGPKMIELGARMGGDCIATHLVPLSTGIDMVKGTLDISCGLEPDIQQTLHRGSAIRYFNPPNGVIRSITGVEEAKAIPGIREIVVVHGVGEQVDGINNSGDRVGFVIAQADTPEQAVEICEKALKLVHIEVE